jgi:hypothetical protein
MIRPDTHDPLEEGYIPDILDQYPRVTPCRYSLLGSGAKSRAYLVEPESDATVRVLKLYGEGWRTRPQITSPWTATPSPSSTWRLRSWPTR